MGKERKKWEGEENEGMEREGDGLRRRVKGLHFPSIYLVRDFRQNFGSY